MSERKAIILANVEDMVTDFLYYDRKGDEDLPRGEIEEAIAKGEITVEEIVELFRAKLVKGVKA